MFRIDVLGSKHGDCLIVEYGNDDAPRRILIDGGPGGVYRRFLRPHLLELREESGSDRPVTFELAMVSHIDQDHILGLLDLTDEMIERDGTNRDPARIKRFWHNSFSDLTGGVTPAALAGTVDAVVASAEVGGQMPFASLADGDGRAVDVLASINQGRKLRDNLVTLGLDGNRPFGGTLVMAGKSTRLAGGMEITVVGPDEARLTDLQQKWNPSLDPAEIARISDTSVANLSSIVALLECEQKKVLLTGDARGDDIVTWLEAADGLKQAGQPFHVDVLKMPHHGSDRNVDEAFFAAVTADTYVYCGDGKHDNPEPKTLRMMRNARSGANYDVILSNFVTMEDSSKQPKFVEELRALRQAGIRVDARDEDENFIRVTLT